MTLEQLVTSRWLFYGLVSKIKESEHLDKRNTELRPASAEVMDSPSAFKSVIWCDKKLEWNIIIKGSHRARRNVLIWPNVWLFILKYWKCFFFSIIFARPTPLRWIPLPRSFSGRKYCVLRLFFPPHCHETEQLFLFMPGHRSDRCKVQTVCKDCGKYGKFVWEKRESGTLDYKTSNDYR